MKYALVFFLLAICLTAQAIMYEGLGWLLLWPALSFGLFALVYAADRPALLGKRSDGRLAIWAWPLFLPVFVFTWGVWHVQRLLSREKPCHEVESGIWIGRRCFVREVPSGIGMIVDLTAEFPRFRDRCAGREYVCLPTLD